MTTPRPPRKPTYHALELALIAARERIAELEARTHPVLNAPLDSTDVPEARTVRDYLIALLTKVWEEREAFNAKRPFGYAGWESDVEIALVRAGLVKGSLDEDGYLATLDDEAAHDLVVEAIKHLEAYV